MQKFIHILLCVFNDVKYNIKRQKCPCNFAANVVVRLSIATPSCIRSSRWLMIPTKTQAFCFLTFASCSVDVEGLTDLLKGFPPHPVCHDRAAQVDQFINVHVVPCMQHTIQEHQNLQSRGH
jgi:hypothetical protein